MPRKNILITGCAGFIGYHLALKLLTKNYNIFGIDSINNYYDINLKKKRLKQLQKYNKFIFYKNNLSNKNFLLEKFKMIDLDFVFHLAAQAGVRLSFSDPDKYFNNNIKVFFTILEFSRFKKIKRLFYASSSSVYGNQKGKHHEKLNINPINFYGLTKKMNEDMANIYYQQFNLKSLALRFFSVYGEYGRPDMAYYNFAIQIKNNKKINLYNNGNDYRDYSYIEDVIESIYELLLVEKKCSNNEIVNIGYGKKENICLYKKTI